MNSSPPSRILLLTGNDGVTRSERRDEWIQHYSTVDGRDFDVVRFDGRQGMKVFELKDALASLPMIQKHKCVIIDYVDFMKGDVEGALGDYCKEPWDTVALLMCAEKVDSRKAWVKYLKAQKFHEEMSLPKRAGWDSWISDRIRRMGFQMTPDAQHFLVEWIGEDPWRIVQELKKIQSFCVEKKMVQLKDVEEIISGVPLAEVFGAVDSLFEGVQGRSWVTFRRLLMAGEAPLKMLALLSRHTRLLLQVRSLMAQGIRAPQVLAQKVGVNPYFVRRYIDQGGGWAAHHLVKVMGFLAEADRQFKGNSKLPADLVFESLLMKISSARS